MNEAPYVRHSYLRHFMHLSRFYAAPQNFRLAKPAVSFNSMVDPLLYRHGHNKDKGYERLLSEEDKCSAILVNISFCYLAQLVESMSFCSTCVIIYDVISLAVFA